VRRLLALPAVLLALAASPAVAPARAADLPGDLVALISRVGTPADADSVGRLVRHKALKDPEVAMNVVGVLWHAGGPAAAKGLVKLSDHASEKVRIEALRGVAHLGLRLRESLKALRACATDRNAEIRAAALGVLGRVGDAEDLPTLIDATEDDVVDVRQEAYRALGALSGQHMQWQSGRWESWWAGAKAEMPARLDAAVRTISEHASDKDALTDVLDARRLLAQHGWISNDDMIDVARAWLRSSDPALRIQGFDLAAALRLGDLADDVSSTFRYERDPDVWPVGLACATVLGVKTAGEKPPPPRRDR
jgi:HEAT repeat protein